MQSTKFALIAYKTKLVNYFRDDVTENNLELISILRDDLPPSLPSGFPHNIRKIKPNSIFFITSTSSQEEAIILLVAIWFIKLLKAAILLKLLSILEEGIASWWKICSLVQVSALTVWAARPLGASIETH